MQGLVERYEKKLEIKEYQLDKMQKNKDNYSDIKQHIKCIKIEIRLYRRFIKDLKEWEI